MELAMSRSTVDLDEVFEADVSCEWATGIKGELDKPAMLDARYDCLLIYQTLDKLYEFFNKQAQIW